jgi:hypothetical protein
MLNLTEEMLNGELTTVWYQSGEYVPPKRFRFSLYADFLLEKAKSGRVSGVLWDEGKKTWSRIETYNLENLFLTEKDALISYYSNRYDYALSMKAHHQSNANYELSKVKHFDDLSHEVIRELSLLKGDNYDA